MPPLWCGYLMFATFMMWLSNICHHYDVAIWENISDLIWLYIPILFSRKAFCIFLMYVLFALTVILTKPLMCNNCMCMYYVDGKHYMDWILGYLNVGECFTNRDWCFMQYVLKYILIIDLFVRIPILNIKCFSFVDCNNPNYVNMGHVLAF